MKPNKVKQEYQLQQWRDIVREQKESGLTVRQWCADQGVTKHAFYYRLPHLPMGRFLWAVSGRKVVT